MNTIFKCLPIFCTFALLAALPGSALAASTGPTSSGDIPDTATYLTLHGQGYTIRYVEGWRIRLGPGAGVTIGDKDSSETISVAAVPRGRTGASMASTDLAHLAKTAPHFKLITRRTVRLAPGLATYAQYHTLSPQDAVTGKRVPVLVDRYYIPGPRKEAIVTLATPVGVDNVDAFKLISRSFRWK